MNNSNYNHTLKLVLKGIESPLFISVRKDEYDRLLSKLDDDYFDSKLRKFFNCSALDGKLYSVNLKLLQHVHFLWDPTDSPLDRTLSEDQIEIYLVNQKSPIRAITDASMEVYDFFVGLESDDGDAFKGFSDIDGEWMYFQLSQIIYATTPEDLYEEGEKLVEAEDNL